MHRAGCYTAGRFWSPYAGITLERCGVSDTGKKIILLTIAVVLPLGVGELVLRAINYGAITPGMNFGINTKMSLDQGIPVDKE